jgi:hypothetical protein
VIGRVRRAATPRAILAVAAIGLLLYAYPGFLPTESVDELVDSRVGLYTDWHSPVMTEIWRWVGYFVSGPAPLLVLQGALFLAGAYHLLRRLLTPRRAAIAAGALLWFPPVLATMAVIYPVALLTAFSLAGAAALASPRRGVQLAGLGLLLLACGLCGGAPIAVLPIVVLGHTWLPSRPGWQRLVVAAGVWLVLVAGAAGLRRWVTDTRTGRSELTFATRDITGVLKFSGPISDAELRDHFAGVPLVPASDLRRGVRTWYPHPEQLANGPARLFDPPATPGDRDRILAARWRLARAHPLAYLRHRWHVFARVLGLVRPRPASAVYTLFTEQTGQRVNLQFAARYSVIQRPLVHAMRAIATTFVFRPYLYLALAVLALALAAVRRDRAAAMLLASALGYELALMFVAVDPELRDSQWLVAATVLAVILLAARALARRRARRPDPILATSPG